MAFEWKGYLDLARDLQQLVGSPLGEAGLRSAVSRAYFAAYCHARNYARDHLHYQFKLDDPGDHGRLRARFREQHMVDVARRLDSLRQWRNQCDYYDTLEADLSQMVTSAISDAGKVITRL